MPGQVSETMTKAQRVIKGQVVNGKCQVSYIYTLNPEQLIDRKNFIQLQLDQVTKDLEFINLRKGELEEELTAVAALIEQ